MPDKLIRIDHEKNKAIFLRTEKQENGSFVTKEIEVDLPKQNLSEGILRKTKFGPDGKMYETEEKVYFPIINKQE